MDSSAEQEEVTRGLWAQLRCMCGECDGETLELCTCDDAAREREKIAEFVRAHDTSRPDKVTAVAACNGAKNSCSDSGEMLRSRSTAFTRPSSFQRSESTFGADLGGQAPSRWSGNETRRQRPDPARS